MPIVNNEGHRLSNKKAQTMIKRTIERFGRFILSASECPPIGEIQEFAGLPLKCVRHVTEAEAYQEHWEEVWGPWTPSAYYFEAEVAD